MPAMSRSRPSTSSSSRCRRKWRPTSCSRSPKNLLIHTAKPFNTSQLAAKDAVIAQKELESQAMIAQLQAALASRDKELEDYVDEVEAAQRAALQVKDDEAAQLQVRFHS
jgi:hypothetical protein